MNIENSILFLTLYRSTEIASECKESKETEKLTEGEENVLRGDDGEEEEDNGEEVEDDDEFDEDDEDLISMRETMQSLLFDDGDGEEGDGGK